MNTLSWMIYLADLCGNLRLALAVMCFALTVTIVISLVNISDYHEESKERAAHARRIRMSFCVLPAVAIIAATIPSKETVYAVAASEMGEQILQTDTAGKARQALNAWLDKQIEGNRNERH